MADRVQTSTMSKTMQKRRKSVLRHRIITVLSCIVVFCTVYALIIPAISMSPKAYCGCEEHEHTEECYTEIKICPYGNETDKAGDKVLICTESEETATEKVLTCTNEDENHEHTEECYEEVPAAAHEHTEECYHIHTEACFEKKLTCGKEAHKHTLACYSNPKADVESLEYIESTVKDAKLTGNCREDLVAIAKTQVGYKESKDNYKVSEDGVSTNGYTRYGEWYGEPYCDWSAAFASFCLSHAGINQCVIPYGTDTAEIMKNLQSRSNEDSELFAANEAHTPEAGEIVFIGNEHNGEITADHMGIVTVYNKEENTITVIVGDSDGKVEEKEYKLSSPSILGFGITPEENAAKIGNTLCYEDEKMTVTAVFDSATALPEGAELTVSEKEIINDSEYDEIAEQLTADDETEEKVLSAVTVYDLSVTDNGEEIDISDSTVDINIEYKESPFTADEMDDAEISAMVLENARTAMMAQAMAMQSANGLASLSLPAVSAPNEVVVALLTTPQTGSYWKKITSTSELQSGDTVIIVGAEGYRVLAYNQNTVAHLVPVPGNPLYFTADNITDAMKLTVTPNGTSFRFRNVGYNNQRIRLTSSAVFGTQDTNITVTKVGTEECFNLRNGNYYLTAGDNMTSSSNSTATKRSMYILKLVDATLDVLDEPNDEDIQQHEDQRPDFGEYTATSGAKTGTDMVEGSIAAYASDPATSQIEALFTGTSNDDGKVISDKSVIYGDDDYGAFENYENGTFGVTLSALGQNTHTKEASGIPMDVVIILDTSYSMLNRSYANSEGNVRIIPAIASLNACIDAIMTEDSRNRVGVVTFSDFSSVMLPLDRYTKTGSNYIDLNIYAKSGDYHNRTDLADITAAAGLRNSRGQSVTINFEPDNSENWEGTYTQTGIQEAGDMLLAADTTTEDGTPRKPLIIMISDGAPTLCTNNYMEPKSGPCFGNSGNSTGNDSDNGATTQNPDTNRYGINGYYTVLTANYYKRMVASHYAFKSSYYSIGIGVSETSTQISTLQDNTYCRAVLDPSAARIAAVPSGSNYIDNESGAFLRMLNNTETRDYYAIPNHYNGYTVLGITHSRVPVIKNPYASDYAYADNSFFGDFTTQQMTEALLSIVNAEQDCVYTSIDTLDIDTDVVLTDPIGEGMEIKGMPVLNYAGVNHNCVSQTIEGNTVTYHYAGQILYPYHSESREVPPVNLAGIRVTVTTDANGLQTVQMAVPASEFPAYFTSVGGSFFFEQLPVRLIYQVGLTQEAVDEVGSIEVGETLTYYTNRWEGTTATSTFTPTATNPYTGWNTQTAKTENTTSTIPTSFTSAKPSANVNQTLGNNGRLSFTKESATVTVEKQWSNGTNHDDITVYLLANGDIADEQTIGNSNNWTYTWENLEKYDSNGNEIEYTVSEQYVPGYTSTITKGRTGWQLTPASSLQNGRYYVFADNVSGSTRGYALSGYGDEGNDHLQWLNDISDSTVGSDLSVWKASGSGTSMSLENQGRPGWYLYVGGDMRTTYPRNTTYNVYLWNQEFSHWTYTSNNLKANSPQSYNFGGIPTQDGSQSVSIGNRNYTCYYYAGYGKFISEVNNNLTLYEATRVVVDENENLFVINNTADNVTPLTLTIKKISKNNTSAVLAGAKFTLYREDEEGINIPGTHVNGILIDSDLTTGSNGLVQITVPGEDGTYYLVETQAPQGYLPMNEPVVVQVQNGEIIASQSVYISSGDGMTLTVKNYPENDSAPPQFEHQKTIDYLHDGDTNPDTDLEGEDLYRLYLDMTGKQEPIDLVFVVDGSGSMSKTDMEGRMRRDTAITEFLNGSTTRSNSNGFLDYFLSLNDENQVTVVQFYGNTSNYGRTDSNLMSSSYPGYSTDSKVLMDWTSTNRFVNCANQDNNGTNYEAGLKLAADQFEQLEDNDHKKVMIFLSDGVPTFFLVDANDVGAYSTPTIASNKIGQRWGNGQYNNTNNYPYCKEPSKKAFDDFHAKFPDVITYTVGVSNDISATSQDESQSPEVLQYIAEKGGGSFLSVDNNMAQLKLDLESIFYPKGVTITDSLSKYDRYYAAQPDVKVTMTNLETDVVTVLYENGENLGVLDENGNQIFDHIEYSDSDTSFRPTGSTGTIKAVFGENYCFSPEYKYTLSFNVGTTQTAFDEYAANGSNYAGMIGQPDTDYGTNTTSSNKPGFRSNTAAYVDYEVCGTYYREYYDHPVIQVRSAGYELPMSGGNGIIWFTIGGAVLAAFAVVAGILWRARERRYD